MLGSGGILGAAHAGVIKVLRESGVRVGAVAGASVGSIFALPVAAGWDGEWIERVSVRCPIDATFRLYLNRLRVDRSTVIGRLLCEIGEDTRIEDLPVPFACMVLDWDSGEVLALRNGPVLRAIQASMAVPWLARPVEIDGRRYVDGGLKGPIPATVVREMGAEYVISVRLAGRREPGVRLRRHEGIGRAMRRYGQSPEGARITALQQLRFALRTWSLNFDPVGPGTEDAPDLEIWPRFYGLRKTAPFGARFCVRQGERAAREALGVPTSSESMMETSLTGA